MSWSSGAKSLAAEQANTHGAHEQLTRAVQCDLTWTEDRAPVRTDPSAAPGAETEGRAGAFNSTARPFLRDRHLCDKPLRPESATLAAWSRTVLPYALPTQIQFTLNQDKTAPPDLPFGIGTYAINLRGRRPRLKRHGAARCSLTPCPRDSSSR